MHVLALVGEKCLLAWRRPLTLSRQWQPLLAVMAMRIPFQSSRDRENEDSNPSARYLSGDTF